MSSVLEAGVAEITNQLEYDDEVAFHAVRRLFDHARYEPETPLCLCVSFTHPHDPYVARRRHWDLYGDDEIDLPAAPAVPDDRLDPHSRRLRKAIGLEGVEISEDDVRASRHGYYASLSYVDEKIGEVLDALGACGMADDTIVVFTSDHGDFLGEHGLFYKMSFREHSARVPLIVHAPGRFAARRVREPVSLADVPPTLAELARPGLAAELGGSLDGRSLVPLLKGEPENPDGAALGEYLAEGTIAPMLMVRRGRWKLIHAPGDPDQLFDLERDPLELENLAGREEHAATLAALRDEVQARWDLAALERDVRESQRERLAVFGALQRGKRTPWDYQPLRDASTQYTRNTMDVAGRDRESRFPPAGRRA
jgi:choline-sulfatase